MGIGKQRKEGLGLVNQNNEFVKNLQESLLLCKLIFKSTIKKIEEVLIQSSCLDRQFPQEDVGYSVKISVLGTEELPVQRKAPETSKQHRLLLFILAAQHH